MKYLINPFFLTQDLPEHGVSTVFVNLGNTKLEVSLVKGFFVFANEYPFQPLSPKFSLSHINDKMKYIFVHFLTELKTYHLSDSVYKNMMLLTLLILAVCRVHVIHELCTGPHSWSLWLSCKASEGSEGLRFNSS